MLIADTYKMQIIETVNLHIIHNKLNPCFH